MTTARLPSVAAALAALALASGARAQPISADGTGRGRPAVARLELVRRAGAEARCPDAPALATLVDTVANRPAIARDPDPADVALWVTVEPAGNGFRATLRAEGARTGERVLEDTSDASCGALAEAIAVTTVLLLDAREEAAVETPAAGAGRELAPRIPVPVPAVSVPAAPVGPPPGSAPADTSSPTEAPGLVAPADSTDGPGDDAPSLAVGAPTAWSVDAAILGGATVTGGGVEIGAWGRRRLGPGSVGLGARITTPSEHAFANGAVEVWSARGTVEGCLELRAGDRVILAPCGTAALGAMVAQGQGFDRTDAGLLPTLSLGGVALAALGIAGGTAVLVRVGVAGSPVRPSFEVEDDGAAAPGQVGEAYRAPALVADAGAGLRLSFD